MTFRSEPTENPVTGDSHRGRDEPQEREEPSDTERTFPGRGDAPPTNPAWSAEIETVYREQGREIWALFYAQCNDPDRAHDALQEAFLRLQEQNGEQNGEAIREPRAWVVRVGRNWLRDVARRQRVAAKPTEGLDALPREPRSHGTDRRDDPRHQLEHEELLSRVREGLSHMKEQDREVLVLRYALGWSSTRIAEVLGSSASAIDMRLSRARKRLAKHLESIGANE